MNYGYNAPLPDRRDHNDLLLLLLLKDLLYRASALHNAVIAASVTYSHSSI